MADQDPTLMLPKQATPPQAGVTDSQIQNLFAMGEEAFATQPTSPSRGWQPPTVEALQQALPQYEITALIARGGMGAVYKGMQKTLKRPVAIKVLPPDLEDGDLQFAARFKHEAQALAQLSHPNIVAVFDAGETPDGLLYFVMEFVEGTDVAQLIASEGRLEPLRAIQITTAVCEALAFAHEEGIIHRDIKPSNIMIDKRGRVKVADFGLAKTVNVESTLMTRSNVAMGTPDFIAPEALMPGVQMDGRADLYAVGVMLYQMLTGTIPRGRFELPSGVIPQVDKAFDAVVDKAMQTDREKRYSSATEMKRDVEAVTAPSPVAAPARAWSGPGDAPPDHRLAAAATKGRKPLLLGIAAAIILGTAVFFLMDEPTEAEGGSSPSTTPPLPVSQSPLPTWRKAITRFEDVPAVERAKGTLRWQDGWLEPTSTTQFTSIVILPGPKVSNGGIRVRGRWSPDIQIPTLGNVFLCRSPVADGTNEVYRANVIGPPPSSVALTLANDRTKAQEELARLPLQHPLKPGDEYELELIAIGDALHVRLNDERLPVVTDTRLKEGTLGLHCIHPMRDVEVINLDGLSEAEARKAAGIEGRANGPPPAAARPQSGALGQSAPDWRKVLTKPEDLPLEVRGPGVIEWKDGWMDANASGDSPSVRILGTDGRNQGIRLHGKVTALTGSFIGSGIWLRRVSGPNGKSADYRLFLGAGESPVVAIQHDDRALAQESETLTFIRPEPVLKPGDEYDMELFAIGGKLIARFNGRPLAEVTDTRLTEGYMGIQSKHLIRDVEVINLDGLSEAEARKVVGKEGNDE